MVQNPRVGANGLANTKAVDAVLAMKGQPLHRTFSFSFELAFIKALHFHYGSDRLGLS
jgi:hypothetical protein